MTYSPDRAPAPACISLTRARAARMSMSVQERRTEVLREIEFPTGKVRLVKASNRYDRRFRHLAVEWCRPRFVGTDLEEHAYAVLMDWHPASKPENVVEATAFYNGAWKLLFDQARTPDQGAARASEDTNAPSVPPEAQ
jgi:hypothetical protein